MLRIKPLKLYLSITVIVVSVVGIASTANAASPSISRSYQYTGSIKPGSLVSLIEGHNNIVEAANSNTASRFVGVAVASNGSLLEVNNTSNSIQVATNGIVDTLVSTLNGPISSGDQVGVSPFNGVGMKTISGDRYIGIAQSSFNSFTPGATSEQVKNNQGQVQTILVGTIPVGLSIGGNNIGVPSVSKLQKDAETVLGHPISDTRLVVALVVAVISLASIISLIYASIYSTIISIGRNPLAKYEVMRTLIIVMIMVIIIAAVSSISIYLLLK